MAFIEYCAIMASGVLNSPCAIDANIKVVLAFVQLAEIHATNEDLAIELKQPEAKLTKHDEQFSIVFDTIRQQLTLKPSQNRK